ncbi:hypothetical protein A4A49_63184, partial [Nicotiana attenuata]
MLVLLETKMVDHKKLVKDLQFDMIIQSPTIGLSGRIVIMWKEDIVSVDKVATTLQGIHAMVKARKWVVHKGNRVNFLSDTWIPNQPAIRDMIEAPFSLNDLNAKANTVYNSGAWDLSTISMDLPPSIFNL